MRRREFLATVGAAGAALAMPRWAVAQTETPRKPNMVLILADDLGYADVGFQGCKDIPTPNIDSIANGGARFTNGYVSCPVCSPTRAGLMTGRYQQRFGHEFNTGPTPTDDIGLPLDQITVANCLKDAGYVTGLVGKWHLGEAGKYNPTKRGFDEFFGFLPGSHPYVNPSAPKNKPILRGTEVVDEKEYLTDAFTREANDFIRRHSGEPFFLYLAYNAVHGPLQATDKHLEQFEHIADEKRRIHAAQLAAMDEGIGAVLATLREAGILDNTLIFFLSDNGGPTQVNGSLNTPLHGDKATMWEGGIRVPFALQWPKRIQPGTTYDQPVIALDILATSVAAAGGEVPADRPIDSVDLLPFLTGKKEGPPHETLCWRMGDQYAVRSGDLKLIRLRDSDADALYDLAADISETRDLSAERPDDLKRLQDAYAQWGSQMAKPLWPAPQQAQRQRRRSQSGS